MPQLVKGGKWVFGWVIIGPQRELIIPPAAWDEYRFQAGDEVTFIAGSRRSGGFGLSHARLLSEASAPIQMRALAQGRADAMGRVITPATVEVQPGDRLLAVRGSGRALGLVARGPIYQEATRHPELACFGIRQSCDGTNSTEEKPTHLHADQTSPLRPVAHLQSTSASDAIQAVTTDSIPAKTKEMPFQWTP